MQAYVKKASILLTFVLLLVILFWWLNKPNYIYFNDDNKFGLESHECWFQKENHWPDTQCFFMNTPMNHNNKSSKSIKFPVVIIKSNSATKPPLLHLGAGGPGAPMMLNDSEVVKTIIDYHDDMSIKQGRDLILIDPRGAGLSKPLLNCETFIDNQRRRFSELLTMESEYQQSNIDYKQCITEFNAQDIDLTQFNSLSVVEDLNLLRKSLRIKKWSTIGVSYAAIYAQLMAQIYPESIDLIVMDSAAFIHLKEHQNFVRNTMAPYDALFNYCDVNVKCNAEPFNFENDFWQLIEHLDSNPLNAKIPDPFDISKELNVKVSGFRLIEALIQGVYDELIFYDLPMILDELKFKETHKLNPYLEYLAQYYLDENYADISFMSHFCYDIKPFSDYELIRSQINQLPSQYLREKLKLDIDWIQHCDSIGKIIPDQLLNQTINTSIPTLFLHGEYDPITPLRDVKESTKLYSNHRILSFKASHDIISSDECGEVLAAKFLNDPKIPLEELICQSSY